MSGSLTVADLTRDHFGALIEVDGWMRGYLYSIHDQYHDGYPDLTLMLVCTKDGCGLGHCQRFSDSDPSGYPKTMSTPVRFRGDGTYREE